MGAGDALLSGVADLGQDTLTGISIRAHPGKVGGRVYSRP
jgi:hypothetical protein